MPKGWRRVESKRALTLILLGAFLWSLLNVEWGDGVLHAGGLSAAGEIGGSLFQPELSPSVLREVVEGALRTVAYAVTGLSLALIIGFPLGSSRRVHSPVAPAPFAGGR